MVILKFICMFLRTASYDLIVFCGRDCNYLSQLYQKLQESDSKLPKSLYLYYSRKLSRNCPNVFDQYVISRISGKNLMVDLGGTGAHLNHLRLRCQQSFDSCICIWNGHHAAKQFYSDLSLEESEWIRIFEEEEPVNREKQREYYILNQEQDQLVLSDSYELVNRAPHTSPVKLNQVQLAGQNIFIPIFSGIDDTEFLNVFECCMQIVLQEPVLLPKSTKSTLFETFKGLCRIFDQMAVPFLLKGKHRIDGAAYNYIRRKR